MLKRKGGVGLKPKAPSRRNASGSSSQGPDRQPTKTPAPSPASHQPTAAPTLRQTLDTEHQHPIPSSTSQTTSQNWPINVVAGKTLAPAANGEPVTSSSEPTGAQAAGTTVIERNTFAASERASGAEEPKNASRITQNGPEPISIINRSEGPARVATTISTTETSPLRTDTETASSQPLEPAIPTPTLPATRSRQSTRATRSAAPLPRVPLPTAAPSAPARASEPSTSVITNQLLTPASTTPQSAEPIQEHTTTGLSRSRATQAATPPVESQTNVQDSIEAIGDAGSTEGAAKAANPKRAPRKRKTAAETAETDGDAAPVRKRSRKKKTAVPAAADGENHTEGEGSQPPAAATKKRASKPRAQSTPSVGEGDGTSAGTKMGGFRHRSPTPEDAEEQKVDPSQVTMGDLVKDLRIGKKFSRHDELLERQRLKKLKSKAGGTAAGGNEAESSGSAAVSKAGTPVSTQEPGGGGESAPSATAARPLTEGAPQFQIIDGQIVVNQSTLQFDRHAAAAREAGELEEEVEDDFTHHTTSNTYMKRQQKPNHWTAVETETFYRGLRMFGTDFALLCRMFPGKNRRHVKLKFNREERAHPAKVNAALVGEKTVGIDLEEYKSHTGLEYKSVDEIEAEQARVEEEFEAEQRRTEEQAAEEAKKRQEELFGKKEEVEKKARGKGRRKKEAGGMGLGF